MNEEETRALVREEIRSALVQLRDDAHWFTGDGDLHDSAAYVLRESLDRTIRELTPAEPEPEPCKHAYATNGKGASICQLCDERLPSATELVNPFAPKHTAQEWAEKIRPVIQRAKDDGYDLWFDTVDYFGPGPCLRVSPRDGSPDWENDPIVWEPNNA